MSDRRTVCVRGLGIVSSLGVGVEDVWGRLIEGERGLAESPVSGRGIPVPAHAATIDRFSAELEACVAHRSLRRVSQLSRYCVAAAAMTAPGEEEGSGSSLFPRPDETAVVLGTSYGSSRYHFDYYEKLFGGGLRDASPLLFSECVMNAASGHVSLFFELRGASLAFVGGEEVGLAAIVDAADRIRVGDSEAAIAGGADEYCDFVHAALASRGFVAGDAGASRGLPAFGEGAALLYLDTVDDGVALATLLGSGVCRGRADNVAPAVENAVRLALADADIKGADVDLVVGGVCGSPTDEAEIAGVAAVLGARGDRQLLVSYPKLSFGESFAFASAAQGLVAVRALTASRIPPTVVAGTNAESLVLPSGWILPDSGATSGDIAHALVVSVTRGGSAVAVVFGR